MNLNCRAPLLTLCALLFSFCPFALGASAILHVEAAQQLSLSVRSDLGSTAVVSSPLRPSASVAVVLLGDTLTADAVVTTLPQLISFTRSLHGRSFRLFVLRGGSVETLGLITGPARLKPALEKIEFSAEPNSAVSTALLDSLAAVTPQLGSNWSRVLLVGNFPSLDSSVTGYASAFLLRAFMSSHVVVSWLPTAEGGDAWLPLFNSAGGTIIRGESEPPLPDNSVVQLDWTVPPPASGFTVFQSVISDQLGHNLVTVPEVNAPTDTILPSIEQYAAMRVKALEAVSLATKPANNATWQTIRNDLVTVFKVNPSDPDGLLAGALLNEQAKDYATAVNFCTALVGVRPQEGGSYAALGHALLLNSSFDNAEGALKRAAELNVHTADLDADIAGVHLARKDDRGALTYLDDAVRTDPKRQDLWFVRAASAERLQDFPVAIRSLEEGLAIGGVHVPETAALVRLYSTTGQSAKGRELAIRTIAALPADADLRAGFADALDQLHDTPDALQAWRRVLEVRPGSEQAHYRLAKLLLESGDMSGAKKAADAGLQVAPRAAELYLVKADILEKLNRRYDARSVLEQGATAAPEAALLTRLATTEDTYGNSGDPVYRDLAKILPTSSPERLKALERGFIVSVRDADLSQAHDFAESLASMGHGEYRQLLRSDQKNSSSSVVPGGLDALAFAAHAKEGVSPDNFFLEYCRTLISHTCRDAACGKNHYLEDIQQHFERMAELESIGQREGNRIVIPLSLNGKQARHRTEKVLDLLGIKLHSSKGEVELARGEKKSQAKRQDTVSALALDEVGIQTALQSGKTYNLELSNEAATVYPDEKLWRDTFYPKDNSGAGFAGAALRLPNLPELYVALNSLDGEVIKQLLSAVDLKTLYDRYATLVYLFAPAFAMQNGHAAVPGGANAEPIWAQLVSADPSNPGQFFRALLNRDNGKLLAFFFALSGLDYPHQKFFTANTARTRAFYNFFQASDEVKHFSATIMHDSSLAEFLRSVPLDHDGHVNFPGSAQVWMVAKGNSTNDAQTSKLLKKISKTVAPELEDEILLRLAATRYRDSVRQRTELDNFLAVARIDAHRRQPLDDEAAVLLAQHYSEASDAYAYFTDLTSLSASDFKLFFTTIEQIKSHPALDANLQMGELNALVEWVCLMLRQGTVSDAQAVTIFRNLCQRLVAGNDDASYAAASLETAHEILTHCGVADTPASFDAQTRFCLLGLPGGSARAKDFQRILEEQRVPSLDALFTLYTDATQFSAESLSRLGDMNRADATLAEVQLPKSVKIAGKEKDEILRYDSEPVRKVLVELNEKASKRKIKAKEVEKLSRELIAALQPQVTAALAGRVYAYFLRSSDLVVSEDALLLRKHRYFDFASPIERNRTVVESAFVPQSEGAGSYFLGGFAQFGLASAHAATIGWPGGSSAAEAVTADIAAIRSTDWRLLRETDQRLLSLRATAAREWIVESALHSDVLRALSEETLGVLSLARRADLLNGIQSRNWKQVWHAVTIADLVTLGGKYLQHYKSDLWSSPVTQQLRTLAATNDGSRLRMLGGIPYLEDGCSHPDLFPEAPYEDYERRMPAEMGERAAEFKLYLALRADDAGVDPAVLGAVAEPLAAKAFRGGDVGDSRDWRALLAAYGSVTSDDIKEALRP